MRNKSMYWLPRVMAMLFIGFISLFALDTLGQPQWYLALFMHLIPSFVLMTLLFIAWRNEKWGGVLFMLVGLLMFGIIHSMVIVIPMLIIGVLFIVCSRRT